MTTFGYQELREFTKYLLVLIIPKLNLQLAMEMKLSRSTTWGEQLIAIPGRISLPAIYHMLEKKILHAYNIYIDT